MNLREIRRPIKDSYRSEPEKAKITLTARASEMAQDAMSCSIDIGRAIHQAQAHAGVGGAGTSACSGDLLLGALAACTQITVQIAAEAMGLYLDKIDVTVEGDLDLRGPLSVDPSAPVGFQSIRSAVHLEGEATKRELSTLKELAERYCVVLATLRNPPKIEVDWS